MRRIAAPFGKRAAPSSAAPDRCRPSARRARRKRSSVVRSTGTPKHPAGRSAPASPEISRRRPARGRLGSAPLLPYLQPPLPSLRPRDPHRPRGHRRPLAAPPSPSVPGTRPEDDRWDPARRSSSDRRPLPRALPGAGSRVRSAAGREERRRERREQPRSRSRPPSPSRTQTPPPAGPASHWLRRLGPGGPRTPHWPLALSRNGTARPRPTACLPPPSPGGGSREGTAGRFGVGWAGLGWAAGDEQQVGGREGARESLSRRRA